MRLHSMHIEMTVEGALRIQREDRLLVRDLEKQPPGCPEGWDSFLLRLTEWDGSEWRMIGMRMRFRSPDGIGLRDGDDLYEASGQAPNILTDEEFLRSLELYRVTFEADRGVAVAKTRPKTPRFLSSEIVAGRFGLEPDGPGSFSGAAFQKARLPMVVACTGCGMTMNFFSAYYLEGDTQEDLEAWCAGDLPDPVEIEKYNGVFLRRGGSGSRPFAEDLIEEPEKAEVLPPGGGEE